MTATDRSEESDAGGHSDELIATFARTLALVVRRHGQPKLTQLLAKMAGHNLDLAAFHVMAFLADEPRRMGELADALGLDVSTVSRQVQRLEAIHCVARIPHPTDGRGWVLSITDEGADLLARQRRARQTIIAKVLAPRSAEDIRTASAVLAVLEQGYGQCIADGEIGAPGGT